MKQIFSLSFIIIFTLLFSACEKEIIIHIPNNKVLYVIEGTITDQDTGCTVLVSQTKNVNDNSTFNGISDALVTLENNGTLYTLTETSSGVYQTKELKGIPEQTYQLKVSIKNEIFTASSTMPKSAPFEDFHLNPTDFDPSRTVTRIRFKDNPGTENFYWFELFVNDKKQKNYSVSNNEFTNGQTVNANINFENTTNKSINDLKKGDKLALEMHCIDAPVYLYLYSLKNASGEDNGSPANPVSNITGGALGYFSAQTTVQKSLVIK